MNKVNLHILPECFVDTLLVQMLLQIKGVNHQKGTGAVTRNMQTKFKDAFAIGVIDNDKEQSTYAKESVVIAQSKEITLCKHPDSFHYIIKINNVMEKFILNCANDLGIDLSSEGLPADLEGLKAITKSQDSLNNPLLKKALRVIGDAKEIRLLTDILKYLNDKKYESSDAELQAIFSKFCF